MMRCAFFEMKRLPSSVTPRWTSDSISSMSEPGSTTTPQPMTHRQPGCRMPEGIVCRTYFSRPTTTVWPALLPPANRATTFTCGARRSTTFPLPSSPHCVPTTTMLGMAHTSEEARRVGQELGDHERALRSVRQVERQELVGARPRAPHDQCPAHPLGAGVGERVLEPAADDVAGHRGAEVGKPPREGERRGLVRREVDDEEVGPDQRDGDPLGLHHGEDPRDVEGEADRRAVVAEARQHLVVPPAARHRGAEARHVRLEVGPRVVVEAAHLAEVERHRVGESVDLEQAIDLREVRDRPRRSLVVRDPGGALEHGLAAEERWQGGERLTQGRRRRELPHEARERRGVLAAERGPQLAHARGLGGELLAEAAEEVRVAQYELEALEAERAQAFDRHRDDLDLRLRLLEPDQLDTGLVELAVVRHLRLVVTEDVRHVGEPDGLGLVAQAGRHDAGDLGRDVGAEREQAPGLAVHELEHVLLHVGVGAGREHVRVLVRRGDDLAVAPAREDGEQARLGVPLARRFVGQVHARALGELRRQGPHGAAASRWARVFIRWTVAQPGSYSISVIPAGVASTVQSRSGPRPSASSTMSRVTIAWVTRTIVSPEWVAASACTAPRARSATWARVSPPAIRTRCGAWRHSSYAAGKRAATSSRVSPSHSPNAISPNAGSISTGRRWGFAMTSAEARARSSGLA